MEPRTGWEIGARARFYRSDVEGTVKDNEVDGSVLVEWDDGKCGWLESWKVRAVVGRRAATKEAVMEPRKHEPRLVRVTQPCNIHQRHWFAYYGLVGSSSPWCVRCKVVPNPNYDQDRDPFAYAP